MIFILFKIGQDRWQTAMDVRQTAGAEKAEFRIQSSVKEEKLNRRRKMNKYKKK